MANAHNIKWRLAKVYQGSKPEHIIYDVAEKRSSCATFTSTCASHFVSKLFDEDMNSDENAFDVVSWN